MAESSPGQLADGMVPRREPPFVVFRLDDERTTIVEGLQNLIRICRDDTEAFDDYLVPVSV